jgi:ADP-ribose pyrophosphatase
MSPKLPRSPRTLSSKVAFTGRVFRVERDRVRLSNGRTATLDIVRHRGSVVLIPQPTADTVILVRQFRYAINRWVWELPAGSLDPGEAPRTAARRECAEEIGWWPKRLEKLGAFYPSPGLLDEVMIYYRCTQLIRPPKPAAQDPDEQIEPRLFPLRRLRALIARGDIVDMKTVVGLSLLRR